MVTNSAYLGFFGSRLEENGSYDKTHPHVVNGGITWEKVQKTTFFELNQKRWE